MSIYNIKEKYMDKLSYALGLSMGNNFKASGIETLTVEDFTRGVQAVFEGAKPEMTYDEAKQVINDILPICSRNSMKKIGLREKPFWRKIKNVPES